MALKIRLRQQGRASRQAFRVVVADVRSPRDGKYIEKLGWYNPFLAENNAVLDAERLKYWLSQGAQISAEVKQLALKHAPAVVREYQAKVEAKKVKESKKRRAAKKA